MVNDNTELTILSTTIRRDSEGRYSLSDCWKVSGKSSKDKPSEWYSATKTQEFLLVLEGKRKSPLTPETGLPKKNTTSISVVITGPNEGRGYWADREAVIHYATWISAEFYLIVIRAFDALVQGKATSSLPRKRRPAFDIAFRRCLNVAGLIPHLDQNQKILMAARGTHNMTGINPLEAMGMAALPSPDNINYQTPTQLGKVLGLSAVRVNRLLQDKGLQNHTPGASTGSDWTMTPKGLAYGRLFDTTRTNAKGSQQQLKWKHEVLTLLQMEGEAA